MRNIRLGLEYDGTNFAGWQIQPDQSTVEGSLLNTIKKILHEDIKLRSAGRTDAGVHAIGQVVNFHTKNPISLECLQRALNAVLPDSICVSQVSEVPYDFHARYSAKKRTYKYTINTRIPPSPFLKYYSWGLSRPLDVRKLMRATRHLVGCHDFSIFRASGCASKHAIRTIHTIDITDHVETIELFFTANAFLRKMVRAMVGCLVHVVTRELNDSIIRDMLWSRRRLMPFRVAPPQGLYLYKVEY